MKIYIRFDENGRQIEVTTLAAKPAGNAWKKAPQDFDFAKRYRLSSAGSVEEIPEAEMLSTKLDAAKTLALQELARLIDIARSKYVGKSATKRKSYELQEKAANAVIANVEAALSAVIQPLATIRNIGIAAMAELILGKANVANQKIIDAEAIEDQYQTLIKNAENTEQVTNLLTSVLNLLEGF
jgi:hypothetical protein